ncbi:MAG: chemotaxis protein CheX [Syntrophotaleaceae bacterium]
MDYKEIICQAVEEIFSAMIFMDIAPKDGSVDAVEDQMLSGMVGFAGDLKGTVLLHLPEPVALAITNAFLELDLDEINSEVKDAIGELANMVAGGIKYLLPEGSQNIQLSIPSVISGRKYSCGSPGSHDRVLVGFETPAGAFEAELVVRSGA